MSTRGTGLFWANRALPNAAVAIMQSENHLRVRRSSSSFGCYSSIQLCGWQALPHIHT
jgi:hypothetical protein